MATTSLAAEPVANPPSRAPRVINPYGVGLDSPRLTTPQWVGEPGVEAVVVLAIDDMRKNTGRYEEFLRPILNRLKAIDGRAALSIMTNTVDPADPQLQRWIAEGVAIDAHTITHPCPLLQKGDLAAAAKSYHDCVDLLHKVPGNRPVAFRMPCCDSLNTVSPRFFAEIFNKVSPEGHALAIDSSVFQIFTSNDPSLPRALVQDADGRERFRKYLPFPSFVNTIENYPYPYVLGGLCWEFPCMVPSDWEAQHLQQPNNPRTVADMKAALDAVVLKQGVFNLVFHPHNWIKSEQIVELIDHAVATHGRKVKFLNFREALDRLEKNLLDGRSLRNSAGQDNGVRLVDFNGDGYLDVAIDDGRSYVAREWRPAEQRWAPTDRRVTEVVTTGRPGGRYFDLDEDGFDDLVYSDDSGFGVILFDPRRRAWTRTVAEGKAGAPNALPRIVRNGTNNGFWIHSRHLWWQNEDTAALPDLVDRRAFNDLLKNVEPTGRLPEASRRSIQTRDGFAVQLVASEPLVKDPIAFDWAADGRLWVLEMGDYPLGTDGHGKPGGTVRVLHDTNGDGVYDKATDFLDGLGFPSGLIPWRNGVIVACAPDIFYAEDRDGDGKADHREVLFTGFTEGNQQHRINGFDLGLDGWIYGANGDSGGTVKSLKTGKVVDIRGRDFRFRPDDGQFETESGGTQYGRHRDDWGHWFGNNNPNWAWHYVLSDHDLRRNSRLPAPDPKQYLEPDTRLFPISRTLPRFNDLAMANRTTSANSPTPYRDELFGPHFATSLFVSEPVHNLVHRVVVEPDGVSYRGRRDGDEAKREFLASSDNWFRPTMLRTGPDGALYVADMYRAVIEHPEWIPDDWEARIDLRAGSDQGRIYRVYPVDRRPRPIVPLDRLNTAELVAALESPSGWQRDTAQRLLLHKADRAAVAPLRTLAKTSPRPKTRLQALWVLENLGALAPADVLTAVNDPHPQVRRNALEAAKGLLRAGAPGLVGAFGRLVDDPDPQVRLQLALSLGESTDREAGLLLARLVHRDRDDRWVRVAVLSSAPRHVAVLLGSLFSDPAGTEPPSAIVEPLFALAGSLNASALADLVRSVGAPAGQGGRFASWQFSALAGLLDAAERASRPIEGEAARPLDALWQAARALAEDEKASDDDRIRAVRSLGRDRAHRDEDRERLAKLLRPQLPSALQRAAITALGRTDDPKVPELLLAGWKHDSPQLRDLILDTLLSRDAWAGALLFSLEDQCTPASEIGPTQRTRLLSHRDARLRSRAEKVFAGATRSRQTVIDSYQSAIKTPGDPEAGAAVFKKACATCHRLGSVGTEVGADLASLSDKSPQSLLVAILDPSRAFEARFTSFNVALKDGRVLTGMIANESGASVTLRRQEGKEDVILRTDIDELVATGQSLMPEGLEKDLSPKDVADVIAYLGSTGPPPKQVAGNQPARVAQNDDGTVVLRAQTAEIFGDSLTFEPHYGNLGYWSARNDHAGWRFTVNRPGRFAVWFNYACENHTAGQPLILSVGGQQIEHKVAGTGSWDDYQTAKVGEVTLSAGDNRLDIRPSGRILGALIDLRAVELRPIGDEKSKNECCGP
jgi:putative membrane-bound dehydrogenase-like protein